MQLKPVTYLFEYNGAELTVRDYVELKQVHFADKIVNYSKKIMDSDNPNTMLIKCDACYYFISAAVQFEFASDSDDIWDYCSPMGRNLVPYPYFRTPDWTYIIWGRYRAPTALAGDDPYQSYYRNAANWETY